MHIHACVFRMIPNDDQWDMIISSIPYPVSKGWRSGCMCGCTLSPIISSEDVWNGKQEVKEEIWIWNAYQHLPRGANWTPRDGELTPLRNHLAPFGRSRYLYKRKKKPTPTPFHQQIFSSKKTCPPFKPQPPKKSWKLRLPTSPTFNPFPFLKGHYITNPNNAT